MIKRGSQVRETLKEAGYVFIKFGDGGEALVLSADGEFELFAIHNDHSGWTLEIDGVGYEFCRSLTNSQAYKFITK